MKNTSYETHRLNDATASDATSALNCVTPPPPPLLTYQGGSGVGVAPNQCFSQWRRCWPQAPANAVP
ncbi:MAG: hypothetical protein LBD14_02260 [Puniceicoccales bacterium]|nr:hypothetical protein [Puniceicoccales bacterium]